ncbi:MAG: aspartate kinase [Saprospiraceae bacterium]
MKVFKFGGASVKNADAIKNVASILKEYKDEKLVIVVSAMGKTTNHLEDVVKSFFYKKADPFEALKEVKDFHYKVMNELFEESDDIFDRVNDTLVEIEWVIEDEAQETYDYLYDQIVSIGEFLSTQIVSAYLNKVNLPTTWLDARDVILTDNRYREAQVDWAATTKNAVAKVPKLLEKGFVMTQGFVGGTSENFTTTLGREGSDYTAAIFSYCLDAESMSVWKDVPGILTADPRLFKNVTKLDRLSYREAIEMTYYGAKVIHPKTIKPIQNKSIPLFVKSFIDPKGEGTMISAIMEQRYPPMIVVEKDQVLIHVSRRDFSFVEEENLSELFHLFKTHRIKVNLMQNSAISFSICVNNIPERVDKLLVELEKEYKVIKDDNLELITIRHYKPATLQEMKRNKMVLLEERIPRTIQLVVRDTPLMERI